MDTGKAVTQELRIDARIASFCQLSDEAQDEILSAALKAIVKVGHKHNFIVWRVVLKIEDKK